MLLSESGKSLLLGVGIDVGADDKGNDVEERHPGLLRQELLGESQGDGGGGPGDLHDGHETGADGGADLVEGAGACNDGHAGQVDCVLNGGDLNEGIQGQSELLPVARGFECDLQANC